MSIPLRKKVQATKQTRGKLIMSVSLETLNVMWGEDSGAKSCSSKRSVTNDKNDK